MKLASDLQKLIKNPSAASRGSLAAKVASAYCAGGFSDKENAIAADIFRLLLQDAEKSIRKTLSEHLCNSKNAPHDVILQLANDETDVAARILQFSLVLTDDDLLAIVASTKEVLNLCAIAKRSKVSERVSDSLLNAGQAKVLRDLFNNKGANLSEKGLMRAWENFANDGSLMQTLVRRGGLPLTVAEKLYSVVSDELKNYISREYRFTSPIVHKAALDAREWRMLGLMPIDGIIHPDDDEQVEDLVEQLAATGRLTHSLIIRALCMGTLNLFETALARMAGVPRVNARILLTGGANGFHAIYKTAHMPEGFAVAVEKLLNIALSLSQYGYSKPDDFRKRVIEEVYIKGYHRTVDGMGYLLSIIGGRISDGSSALVYSEFAAVS